MIFTSCRPGSMAQLDPEPRRNGGPWESLGAWRSKPNFLIVGLRENLKTGNFFFFYQEIWWNMVVSCRLSLKPIPMIRKLYHPNPSNQPFKGHHPKFGYTVYPDQMINSKWGMFFFFSGVESAQILQPHGIVIDWFKASSPSQITSKWWSQRMPWIIRGFPTRLRWRPAPKLVYKSNYNMLCVCLAYQQIL